jgi:hypothetical protein
MAVHHSMPAHLQQHLRLACIIRSAGALVLQHAVKPVLLASNQLADSACLQAAS